MHCDTRRINRTGFGAATVGALAGWTSSDVNSGGSSGSRSEAQSSFVIFEDFTSQVAGEIATAERRVPIIPDPDWGCVEIMEIVNLETLKKALGAA
ncbi:hypothetical protein [Halocatena marina]|uniref:hypothetical protein n=1 Tax=Halocatena marina TaxID=2934937 RepID=UPI002223F12D|nr:hypothetical protein [Halocatena marina]